MMMDKIFSVMGSMVNSVSSDLPGPVAISAIIVASLVALTAICACCKRCKLRDCACCKRCLRATGQDPFDDFELMLVVHQVLCEKSGGLAGGHHGVFASTKTNVQVSAGAHSVQSEPSSNGIFQQPLHITVEQGTEVVTIDWLKVVPLTGAVVLSTLTLNIVDDVLKPKHESEHAYAMKQKGKGIQNAKIKLTLSVEGAADCEKGLIDHSESSDVNDLVRLHLAKAQGSSGAVTELQLLQQACAGPLECFEGLGRSKRMYVAILGPPHSRHWMFGVWNDQHEFESNKKPVKMIDLMRLQSVSPDPSRHHVFVINYFDELRVRQALTLRRIDRARDVWVEVLLRFVQKIHESRHEKHAHAPRKH